MFIKDLFERDNVPCPEWLDDYLEDEWMDSVYSFEDNVHYWKLHNPLKNVVISFDGEEYRFRGFDDSGEVMFMEQVITEEGELIT